MHVDLFDSQRSYAPDAGLVCTTTQHRIPHQTRAWRAVSLALAVSVVGASQKRRALDIRHLNSEHRAACTRASAATRPRPWWTASATPIGTATSKGKPRPRPSLPRTIPRRSPRNNRATYTAASRLRISSPLACLAFLAARLCSRAQYGAAQATRRRARICARARVRQRKVLRKGYRARGREGGSTSRPSLTQALD